MGEPAESFHVKGAGQQGVASALTHVLEGRKWRPAGDAEVDTEDLAAGIHRAFLIYPEASGWVSVFPNRWDSEIPQEVSRALAKPVLMLTLFEEGVLVYDYFERGEVADTYKSEAAFLDPDGVSELDRQAARADPKALAAILPTAALAPELDVLLNRPWGGTPLDLLEAFAKALGIAEWQGTYASRAGTEAAGRIHLPFRVK